MNNIFKTPATARRHGFKTTLVSRYFYIVEDKNNLFTVIHNGKPFKKDGKVVEGLNYWLDHKSFDIHTVDGQIIRIAH